jgi:signal transduction histidine kinase
MVPSALFDNSNRYMRGTFAEAIHDLRHAAAVQQLAIEILENHRPRNPDAKTTYVAEILTRSTSHLLWYLDHLLERSLFDPDRRVFTPQHVVLRPALERAVLHLTPVLLRRSQSIQIRCKPDVRVLVDMSSLDHMLTNLLMNASKNSVEGDRVVVTARYLASNTLVEISVRDHGPVLSDSERRVLFSRTAILPSEGELQRGGMALSNVRSMAERQGGVVGVKTPNGPGNRIWLRIPSGVMQEVTE